MAVYVSNIVIPISEDFEQTFTLQNPISNAAFDLNDLTARSHLKKHPSSLTISAIFDITFTNPSAGELILSLSSEITSSLKPGRYSYDILLSDGERQKRLVEGSALVVAGVTT
jgi:hypothetical protein